MIVIRRPMYTFNALGNEECAVLSDYGLCFILIISNVKYLNVLEGSR